MAVLQSQVEIEVAVDVGGVVHGSRRAGSLVQSMSSRNDVLGEVEHVLGSVWRGHQISRVEVEVMEHLIRSLASQLELHLGEQAHHLVDVGALLEERQ